MNAQRQFVPVGFVQVTITFNLQESSQIATILNELDKKRNEISSVEIKTKYIQNKRGCLK
jgi:hypothetical protein